jgi:hypothetical protein
VKNETAREGHRDTQYKLYNHGTESEPETSESTINRKPLSELKRAIPQGNHYMRSNEALTRLPELSSIEPDIIALTHQDSKQQRRNLYTQAREFKEDTKKYDGKLDDNLQPSSQHGPHQDYNSLPHDLSPTPSLSR